MEAWSAQPKLMECQTCIGRPIDQTGHSHPAFRSRCPRLGVMDFGGIDGELFGPITTLHRVEGFEEALAVANASPYGLTAAIWTASIHRGQEFVRRIVAGGVQVNGPTYGFEPHVPFGGQRDSGTGWREPGTEALDVYSDWKTVYVTHDPSAT